jgi:4-hydroxy-3-polyprenylbenzoate decarboxylase
MAIADTLQAFIAQLEKAGELRRIRRTVSARLEISQFTDQESKSPGGGQALFFESVQGSAFPVATNLFGSWRRIALAMGVADIEQLARRLRSLLEIEPPHHLGQALALLPLALQTARGLPRRPMRPGRAPCQQVVATGEAVDLGRLPVLHCWPGDAGPFITLPLVFTRSLTTGRRNVGMYRLQVFDRATTGMHWHVHKDGSHYFSEWRRAGRRMPVAVAIGADPATIYAATAPLPRGVDELLLAGFIRRKAVPLVRCLTVDLEVPAEAEFVLEGYVDPEERRREGPFGDHTGYYSLADDYPVFHVTALTHRQRPVYCATLVGRPPMEDCYLAKVTERLFLPLLQMVFPEIRDYFLPWEGVFHNIVVVAIDKAYAGHAQKVMSGLWGQGQMSFCKAIVVVDGTVNPQDSRAVLRQWLRQFDPQSDLTLTRGVLDVLDHASPHPNFGTKIGVDLTARLAGEPPRAMPRAGGTPPGAEALVAAARRVTGVVEARALLEEPGAAGQAGHRVAAFTVEKGAQRGGRALAEELLAQPELSCFSILLLYDRGIDLADGSLLLWKLFNNVDPGRDLVLRGERIAVDACRKGPMDGHARPWPQELSFAADPCAVVTWQAETGGSGPEESKSHETSSET